MSDALSALSLLLAAFTVLFGLWQPTASAALALKPKRSRLSRDDQVNQVGDARWRMRALLVISLLVAGLFAPRAGSIVLHALTVGGTFDDLRAAFVVAEAFLLALFGLVLATVVRLGRLYRRLDSKADINTA